MDLIEQMEADAERARKESAGKGLNDLGKLALSMLNEIEAAEEELAAIKKRYERLMRYSIPERLAEIGIDEFGVEHDNGKARIKVGTKVVGSLSRAPDEDAAVAFLEESGFSGAVRSILDLEFSEEESDDAQDLIPKIKALTGKAPHLSRKIHPQTLMAFVRAKLKDEPGWDYERVGMTAFPVANFTKKT